MDGEEYSKHITCFQENLPGKKEANHQTTMHIFLRRVIPAQEEPQTGIQGGILEEGQVITGGKCSMPIAAHVGLPVGQDIKVEDGSPDTDPRVISVFVSSSLRRKKFKK